MKKYCVLGTDNRSVKLREMYKKDGIDIVSYDTADIVIAPVPFSRDDIKINGEILECEELLKVLSGANKVLFSGAISNSMKNKLKERKIEFYDLLDLEEVAILNAIPTSEGAIATAMEITDFTLNGSNVLVLGYGRIGKILSKMLSGIGANVYCEARSEKDIAMIKAMGYNSVRLNELESVLPKTDVIFNTIPVLILDEKRLHLLKQNCSVIDLASSPGGVDFSKAKEIGINVVWALSLPGKVAPMSAAAYLKETIDNISETMKT